LGPPLTEANTACICLPAVSDEGWMAEKRILLIEDEATTREILTAALRGEGYEMDSVATAAAANTCLNLVPYALVLADWVLPDGDGIDVADAAAQLGAKTIVITGYISELPPRAAERHELVSKQVGYADILAAVRRAIGDPPAQLQQRLQLCA